MVDAEDYIIEHGECTKCREHTKRRLLETARYNEESEAYRLMEKVANATEVIQHGERVESEVHLSGVADDGDVYLMVTPKYGGRNYPAALSCNKYRELSKRGWIMDFCEEQNGNTVMFFRYIDEIEAIGDEVFR